MTKAKAKAKAKRNPRGAGEKPKPKKAVKKLEEGATLTGKQRRTLRALGHHLEPVVIVGQGGVTPGIVGAVEQALYDHELVKIKVNEGPEDRHEVAEALAKETNAQVAQVLGRTVLLFKQRDEDPSIEV